MVDRVPDIGTSHPPAADSPRFRDACRFPSRISLLRFRLPRRFGCAGYGQRGRVGGGFFRRQLRRRLYPFPETCMEDNTQMPHGSSVFQTHWNCDCERCGPKRTAVRDLVASFSPIPARWIDDLAAHHGEFVPLPMWGTLFLPQNSCDVANIGKLLRDLRVESDDDATFAAAGWQEVARTGILAREFDDELLLGIHGAGYDFYEAHWSGLYDALGYRWHTT